jgi:hypothetical protein
MKVIFDDRNNYSLSWNTVRTFGVQYRTNENGADWIAQNIYKL